MTEREAIELIKKIYVDTNQSEKCIALKMAISALVKQNPKKIENRSVFKTFPMSVHGDCPVCGSKNLSSADTDYCNACGQKLDWGE